MRLFLAFSLTAGLKKKIAFLEEKIDKKFKTKLNWIPLENLHLTVLFLGHLNYQDYLKVENILANFNLPYRNLEARIKKIAYGPPGKKRMIWLYLEKNKKLEEIKNYFEKELDKQSVFYKKEVREFLPHINLIRLKVAKDLPEIDEKLNWSINLNELCLFESYLKKEGAEYKKLKCVKIGL